MGILDSLDCDRGDRLPAFEFGRIARLRNVLGWPEKQTVGLLHIHREDASEIADQLVAALGTALGWIEGRQRIRGIQGAEALEDLLRHGGAESLLGYLFVMEGRAELA